MEDGSLSQTADTFAAALPSRASHARSTGCDSKSTQQPDAPSARPKTPQSTVCSSNQDSGERSFHTTQRSHPSVLCCVLLSPEVLYFSSQSQRSTQTFSPEMYRSDSWFLTFNDSGKLDNTHISAMPCFSFKLFSAP